MIGSVVVFESVGEVVLKQVEVPPPGEGEVLLESIYTVISAGTECANLMGLPNTSGQFPYYPGYSGVARVAQLGPGVENLKVGDRVLMDFISHRSHAVAKAADLVAVADDRVDSLEAALVVIGAMGLQGVRKLRLELGESAMVVGLGILGMFAVQSAALSGAIPVIAVDFDTARRRLALSLGADYAFSPDEEDLGAKIKALTHGRGVDGIVEVTGQAVALQQALICVARQGRVSLTGCTRIANANIDFYKYVHQPGVSLIGAHTFVRPKVDSYPGYWTAEDDHRTLLDFMAAGRIKARPIISEVVSPSRASEVYKRLVDESHRPLGIVFDWKENK